MLPRVPQRLAPSFLVQRASLSGQQLATLFSPGDLVLQHCAEVRAGAGGGCGGRRRGSTGTLDHSQVA